MFRFAAAALTVAMLSTSVAQAAMYDDPEGRFSIDVPADWVASKPNSSQIALVMAGARGGKDLIGLCIVTVTAMPETKSKTQAEIDAALSQEINEEFWKKSMQIAGAADVVVESSGSREASGRRVHYVVVSLKGTGANGSSEAVKGKEEVHAVPGSLHIIACMTKNETYASAAADFDAIFMSYQPKSGLVAMGPPAGRSVLTLFAGPDFTGAARVLGQDASNVNALGLSAPTASIAIAGFGVWEACEGPHFSGTCRRLAVAESAPAGQTLRIGSVRRYPRGGVSGAVGSVSVAVGLAAKDAADRIGTR